MAMKISKQLKRASLVLAIIFSQKAHSQVTIESNVAGGTNYVGWANTVATPLQIRHNGNQHINLFTNSIHRIKLNPDVSYTVNGYAGSRNGYMLLGHSF
jgi:hypothetical protein